MLLGISSFNIGKGKSLLILGAYTWKSLRLSYDITADLIEDMAAEQKARTTYDNILRLVRDDPDVCEPIKFLRAREIVHFQRFGEANREHCSKSQHTNIITKTHTHVS